MDLIIEFLDKQTVKQSKEYVDNYKYMYMYVDNYKYFSMTIMTKYQDLVFGNSYS